MNDSATNAATDAPGDPETTFIRRSPWLPALVCAALIVCAAALPCLAEEPAEDAASEAVPAEAAPAGTEQLAEPDPPRHEDGTINYYHVLVDRYSAGVTPENNGAVLLARALGPRMFGREARQDALGQLGLSDLPEDGPYLESLYDYYDRTVPFEQQEDYDDRAILDEITSRSWSAEDYPIAAAWLDANEGPLDLIVEASHRPRFYLPILHAPQDSQVPMLYDLLGGGLSAASTACRTSLVARVMLRLGLGDLDGALNDLMAIHRMARHLGRGPGVLDCLVGAQLERTAHYAEQSVITGGRLLPEQAADMLADLQSLPDLPDFTGAVETERLFQLHHARGLLRSGWESSGSDTDIDELVDWDYLSAKIEYWHGRWAAYVTAEDYTEYDRLREEHEEAYREEYGEGRAVDWDEVAEYFDTKKQDLAAVLSDDGLSRDERTRRAEQIILANDEIIVELRPRRIYEVTVMKGTLNKLALAVELYMLDSDAGKYPAELVDLAPDYLDEIPVDAFTGEALKYVRTADGCKIYSLGPNMTDDGGFNYDDLRAAQRGADGKMAPDAVMPEGMTEDADDIVIELGRAEE